MTVTIDTQAQENQVRSLMLLAADKSACTAELVAQTLPELYRAIAGLYKLFSDGDYVELEQRYRGVDDPELAILRNESKAEMLAWFTRYPEEMSHRFTHARDWLFDFNLPDIYWRIKLFYAACGKLDRLG